MYTDLRDIDPKRGGTTWKGYLTGYLLSLLLAFFTYFIALFSSLNDLLLLLLTLFQALIQLFLFLHLGKEEKPRWNLLFFGFMALVSLIILIGSIWIMNNLNYNLMP
jgi:cytochrome o ubiquinol oxidase subunit IV